MASAPAVKLLTEPPRSDRKARVVLVPLGQQATHLNGFFGMPQHPERGVTPDAVLAAFDQAERGDPSRQCDLIAGLIQGDGHLRSLHEKREQAVEGKPAVIQAGEDPTPELELAAVTLRKLLGGMLRAVVGHLVTYNRFGWAAVEIEWGIVNLDGRDWIAPIGFWLVPHRRFRVAVEGTPGVAEGRIQLDELLIFTDSKRPHGDQLAPWKWIVLRAKGDQVARAGCGVTTAWPALGKRYGFRDLIVFAHKYGLPLPYAQYKTGQNGEEYADDEAIDTAEKVVANIGNDKGAVMPDTVTLNFAEIGQSGDSSHVHANLISICNREMSKTVNGSTLSNDNSDSGGASYALGAVHDGLRWEAVQYDAEQVQTAIERDLFLPFCLFNALGSKAPEMIIQVVRDLQPQQWIDGADKLQNKLGIKVSVSQARSTLGYREPAGEADAAPGMPAPEPVPIGGTP